MAATGQRMLAAASGGGGGGGGSSYFGATTFTNLAKDAFSASSSWVTVSVDPSNFSDTLVLATVNNTGNVVPTGLTGLGGTWAMAASAYNVDVDETVSVWYAIVSGSSGSVTAAFAANRTGDIQLDEALVQGIDTVTPIKQTATASGGSATQSATLAVAATDPVYGAMGTQNSAPSWTAGAGYTLLNGNAVQKRTEAEFDANGGAALVDMTSTSGVFWAFVAVELDVP